VGRSMSFGPSIQPHRATDRGAVITKVEAEIVSGEEGISGPLSLQLCKKKKTNCVVSRTLRKSEKARRTAKKRNGSRVFRDND